jgi:DNA (cytosine-5)-methyltransferase 1
MKKLIDLFAGAGGLSKGLEMAGFESVLANEINPVYAKTFMNNFPNSDVIVGDIRSYSADDLLKRTGLKAMELDLLAGGPPCQGFSVNAPIRSLDDPRNHLFKDFLKIAEAFLPKAILIENVPGIVSLGKGTVVEQIYKELRLLGYSVSHKILFAAHYGVPQMRYRTIIIGILNSEIEVTFPKPEHNAYSVPNFTGAKNLCLKINEDEKVKLKAQPKVWDALNDLPPIENSNLNCSVPYESSPQNDFQKKIRLKASNFVSNHCCSSLGSKNIERLNFIPQGGSWRDIPFELLPKGLQRARRSDHTKRYGRLHPDQLCSTILTKCDPHWGSFFHPTQNRVISVREAARIQSFPDDFVFSGSLTEQYEQVGNAVPPFLAEAIGKSICSQIQLLSKHAKEK